MATMAMPRRASTAAIRRARLSPVAIVKVTGPLLAPGRHLVRSQAGLQTAMIGRIARVDTVEEGLYWGVWNLPSASRRR